jgi:serine/threonine-protein kinase
VGAYVVLRPLSAGGMATVYVAQRTGPQGFARRVALKVIHPHLSRDAEFVRMFVEEALLCASIRHPNVVHVEELGEFQGAYYLAMEYVDGTSLADVLDQRFAEGKPLPPAVAVAICCAVLEGLHATHTLKSEAGEPLQVVHRDVSPTNILIDRAGHVRLIDFGIAKARGRAVATGAGILKGKYAYMSPEQAWGREVDHRTDVYAASVVLWEMLAMRPLFDGDSDLAVLEQARSSQVRRLSSLMPNVSAALDAAVLHGLAADPARRPESARELRRELLEACPEARSVEPADLAALVGRPSERPPVSALADAAAQTLVSTAGEERSFEQRVSHAAATQARVSGRRFTLWALVALSIAVAGALSWLLLVPRSPSLPPPLPSKAAAVAPPPPRVEAAHSEAPLAPSPAARVASSPASPEAGAESEAHEPPKKPPRKSASRVRDKSEPRTPKAREARRIGGVPIVEQPSF